VGRTYGQLRLSCDCSDAAIFTGLAEQLPRGAVWVTSNLRRTHETAAAIIRAGPPGPETIPGRQAFTFDDLARSTSANSRALLTGTSDNSMPAIFMASGMSRHTTPPLLGESRLAVIERVSRVVRRLVET
jgi:alpha-ribazole phosphatase